MTARVEHKDRALSWMVGASQSEKLAAFMRFVTERDNIRRGKATDDRVLRDYHFGNIRRVHDPTTVQIIEVMRSSSLLPAFVSLTCRWFSRSSTITRIAPLLQRTWDRAAVESELRSIVGPVITDKFQLRWPPGDMITGILDCLDRAAIILDCGPIDTARALWLKLQEVPYVGQFMAELVTTDVNEIMPFRDAHNFNAQGPGAVACVNWIYGTRFNRRPWKSEFYWRLMEVQEELDLALYDIENAMREFYRYVQIQSGVGMRRKRKKKMDAV